MGLDLKYLKPVQKPLHYLFTLSMQLYCIPTEWATHIIAPVFQVWRKKPYKELQAKIFIK